MGDGTLLHPGWESFVGAGALPMRHGMTMGELAAWFVAKDAPNFGVVQMIVAMLLIVAFVGLAAFWPALWKRNGERN